MVELTCFHHYPESLIFLTQSWPWTEWGTWWAPAASPAPGCPGTGWWRTSSHISVSSWDMPGVEWVTDILCDASLTLLITLGLGIRFSEDLSLFPTPAQPVSMWGTSTASQMEWTVLEDIPDWGPNIATTPDLKTWHTGEYQVRENISYPTVQCTSLVSLEWVFSCYFLNLNREDRVVKHRVILV